jgi:S1-C subfamily serine protease
MKLIISLILLITASTSFANDLEKILGDANRYTVKIYNSTDTPFVEDNYNPSSGSGFLIDKKNGIIITNAHVGSYSPALNRINFKYSDPVQTKQVYIDPDIDLELLQIDPQLIPKNAIEAREGVYFNSNNNIAIDATGVGTGDAAPAYADGADAVGAIAQQQAEIVFLDYVRDPRLLLAP